VKYPREETKQVAEILWAETRELHALAENIVIKLDKRDLPNARKILAELRDRIHNAAERARTLRIMTFKDDSR